MKALTWQGNRRAGHGGARSPDPGAERRDHRRSPRPRSAARTCTCTGCSGPYLSPGDVLGHEAMGVVTEVGTGVTNLAAGDRVVIPFNISCGHCWMCSRGLFAQCETTQVREQGKGAALFGYTSLYGSVPGGQAQFLRVPQAQFGPIKVPAGGPDEQYLFLSDMLPTAWQAVRLRRHPQGRDAGRARPRAGRPVRDADRQAPRRRAGHRRGPGARAPGRRGPSAWRPSTPTRRRTPRAADRDDRRPRARTPSSTRSAWKPTATTKPRPTRWPRSRSGRPACCPTGWRARSPTWPAVDRLDALHTAVKARPARRHRLGQRRVRRRGRPDADDGDVRPRHPAADGPGPRQALDRRAAADGHRRAPTRSAWSAWPPTTCRWRRRRTATRCSGTRPTAASRSSCSPRRRPPAR